MPKKAIKSRTQGRKNKVLKRHIDLTSSNKMPPLDKSPPTFLENKDLIKFRSGNLVVFEALSPKNRIFTHKKKIVVNLTPLPYSS